MSDSDSGSSEWQENGRFKEGNPGGGRPAEHGLYQSPHQFFDERPELEAEKDELIEELEERAQDPVLHRYEIKRYAEIVVRLDYFSSQHGQVDDSDTWNVYRSLSTDARQILKSITWSEDVEREEERVQTWQEALANAEEQED